MHLTADKNKALTKFCLVKVQLSLVFEITAIFTAKTVKIYVFIGSLDELLHKLYIKAGRVQDWNVIRHCSGLLRKIVDSLAPAISTILVRGKVVGSDIHKILV